MRFYHCILLSACALSCAAVADNTLAPADNATTSVAFKGQKASAVPTAPAKQPFALRCR